MRNDVTALCLTTFRKKNNSLLLKQYFEKFLSDFGQKIEKIKVLLNGKFENVLRIVAALMPVLVRRSMHFQLVISQEVCGQLITRFII